MIGKQTDKGIITGLVRSNKIQLIFLIGIDQRCKKQYFLHFRYKVLFIPVKLSLRGLQWENAIRKQTTLFHTPPAIQTWIWLCCCFKPDRSNKDNGAVVFWVNWYTTFLLPQANKIYECRFELSDPDGVEGVDLQEIKVKTRAVPAAYEEGRTLHVYPPGFKGEKQEPAFEGFKKAYYGSGLGDWSVVSEKTVHNKMTAPDPQKPHQVYHAGDLDFTLNPDGKAVDKGTLIPNINDNYMGKAPDLGALEAGDNPPVYGPRGLDDKVWYK